MGGINAHTKLCWKIAHKAPFAILFEWLAQMNLQVEKDTVESSRLEVCRQAQGHKAHFEAHIPSFGLM